MIKGSLLSTAPLLSIFGRKKIVDVIEVLYYIRGPVEY